MIRNVVGTPVDKSANAKFNPSEIGFFDTLCDSKSVQHRYLKSAIYACVCTFCVIWCVMRRNWFRLRSYLRSGDDKRPFPPIYDSTRGTQFVSLPPPIFLMYLNSAGIAIEGSWDYHSEYRSIRSRSYSIRQANDSRMRRRLVQERKAFRKIIRTDPKRACKPNYWDVFLSYSCMTASVNPPRYLFAQPCCER